MMRSLRIVFAYTLFQFLILMAAAQTSATDEVWLPLNFVEDIKLNKTFLNKKEFCSPVEAVIIRDGEPYFKTYLGRVTKAVYRLQGDNRYEIENIEPNINRKYFSWDAYKNYGFTIVRRADDVLLLIKSPVSTSSDTIKFVAPVANEFTVPVLAVEGYLLLSGNYKLMDKGIGDRKEEISFGLDGNIVSTRWKSYKFLAASMLLDDKTLQNPRTFLVQLQDVAGNVEERVLLHYGKKELELYKCIRNPTHKYVLDTDSKITLIDL